MADLKPQQGLTWGTGDDPKQFTDRLQEKLEMGEQEVARFLFETYRRQIAPSQALKNLKEQFPHLPELELTPIDEALEFVSQAETAMDEDKTDEAQALLDKALALDPNCVEAYFLQEELLKEPSFEKSMALFHKALEAGKNQIGSQEAFDEAVGEFWSWTPSRPYMLALERLAHACWLGSQREEAIQHAFEMLRLNPDDNQGIRQYLLYWLMIARRWDEAHKLWKQYEEESAWWLYGRSLLTAHRSGVKSVTAKKHFEAALAYNPFVIAFLMASDLDAMYKFKSDYYTPGSPSEAANMLEGLMAAYACSYMSYLSDDEGNPLKELPDSLPDEAEIPLVMQLLFQQVEQVGPRKMDMIMRKSIAGLLKAADKS